MKKLGYISLLLLSFLFFLTACNQKKETDWIDTHYDAKATAPYGFSLFSESMPKLFKHAKVSSLTVSNKIFDNPYTAQRSAYIVLANDIDYSENELWQLEQWLHEGNDVVLIANDFGSTLSNYLYLDQSKYWESSTIAHFATNAMLDTAGHNTNINVVSAFSKNKSYTSNAYMIPIYRNGFKLSKGTKDADTFASAMHVISSIDSNLANAVLFEEGDGRLIVMSTPLAFSNYALLQNNNYHYLEDVMSYLSPDVQSIYLSIGAKREANHSNMSEIWKHKSTRTAILLALLGILLYVIINLRRKQNIIPVIKPLVNDSKSFVETIASLYYNKRNNKNIAQKMIQHFFEMVRTQYKLNTSNIDADFRTKLSIRAGRTVDETAALMYQIKSVQEDTVIVDDKYLHSLYVNIKKFQKK